jgi:hypothetical protein
LRNEIAPKDGVTGEYRPIWPATGWQQIDSAKGFGSHQNDTRYSAGFVFRIGEKD